MYKPTEIRPLPNDTNSRVLLALYIARRVHAGRQTKFSQHHIVTEFVKIRGTDHIANPRQTISRAMSWLNKHGYIIKHWGPATTLITQDGRDLVRILAPAVVPSVEFKGTAGWDGAQVVEGTDVTPT